MTEDEIKAVEALQKQYDSFVYGMTSSIETFSESGSVGGFSALFCEWLAGLFQIPFKPVIYEWGDLIAGLETGEIDFSGDLTPSEERRKTYFMTSAIAQRTIKYIRIKDNPPLAKIAEERPLRLAFLDGSVTYTSILSLSAYPEFEILFTRDFESAYETLKSGKADAFLAESVVEAAFDIYDDVIAEDFFPIIYSPVSLTAQNPKFQPIISIVQKALLNDGSRYLSELYNQGQMEYLKHKLLMHLSEEEKAYIQTNPVVSYVAENDNYPVSFYDTREKEWRGIAFEVLDEIQALTGLTFEIANDQNMNWSSIIEMLEDGRASMITELILSEERKDRFLWPASVIMANDYSALLSKADFRNINISEILYVKVGLHRGTAHTELFNNLFPDHENTVVYDNLNAAFDALERGEIDMVMTSQHQFLILSNFRELTGYKINFAFDRMFDSTFGFNKNDEVLCSIIDKALAMVNTKRISGNWMHKTFDYTAKMIQDQRRWLISVSALVFVLLLVLVLFFIKFNDSKRLENLVQKRTVELENQRMLLHTINTSATTMLSTVDDEKFEDSLLSGMELLCQCTNVDRVQIWQNEMIEDELYFVLKYERLSDTGRQKTPIPLGMKFPYKDKPEWKEKFLRGEYINGALNTLPPADQEFLRQYEVKSIAITPLLLQDHFWGFFSVVDCIVERAFSEEELKIFHSASLMMANAVNRHAQAAKIREARDAAEAASLAKSTFLANMSHEIRTPMNSIMGFSELALDGDIPPKTKDYLKKIHTNAEWLLQIINDILDLSKIESGKMELEKIPFDIHELFTSCRTLILPKAVEKGLVLHFYAEPSIGKRPLGDPTRLRHVFVNLLSNAVKFTNTGMVKLHMAIMQKSENFITMHFEVKDSGIGMTREQIGKIFEPFVQAETGTTRQYGGTGLGLPIAKNIIELMGGKFLVESTPGVGSKFSFDLKFEMIDVPEDEKLDKKIIFNDLEKPLFEGEILLCEDNEMNQQVICEHLARVGFKTVIAENGKIGVEMVQNRIERGERQFDLIFMDMHMPVMDGLEASEKIKGLNPGIPIVALTANVMSNDRELYKTYGMSYCLGKPFSSQQLWRCLMKYFVPISMGNTDTDAQETKDIEVDEDFQKNLKLLFVKGNQNKYEEIIRALKENNIKLANRLAHTLKSNAGQIGKTSLQQAAADVEQQLKDGKNLATEEQLKILETELSKVLDELSSVHKESAGQPVLETKTLDPQKVRELIEKLEPLLESGNLKSLEFVKDIRVIPGSEGLIQKMEDFEFEDAAAKLTELKKELSI